MTDLALPVLEEAPPLSPVEIDMLAGLWVPVHFGKRFKVARLLKDRRRAQEEIAERFANLADAQAECARRNGEGCSPRVRAGDRQPGPFTH